MKRIFKICTVAGAVLFIAGMGLSAFGARSDGFGNRRLGGGETEISGEALESAVAADSLDIELTAAQLQIVPGDTFGVSFGGRISRYIRYSTDGGVFTLRDTMNKNTWGYRWWKKASDEDLKVKITVPEGKTYDRVNIEAGVGEFTMKNITADQVEIDAGVGASTIENVTARTLEIGGGVGEVKARGLTVTEETEVETGVGDVDIQGDLRGKVNIDGGVGEMHIDFAGAREDYSIEVESGGFGELRIDDRKVKGFWEDTKSGNENAPNSVKVDCAMGEIRLNFGKN